ncbi:MAG: hypothetical protein QNJ23_03450 [Woeseiaceae bacterium]|nr:hypothetical protein [Woeseiaceae bacterium]
MIVPEYWSEAKERVVVNGRRRTLKRFGWSDVSEAEALANAKERVAEAAARARAGEQVRTMDHKIPYNGAEGLPIREEIISRHGDAVITRNSYGALCLNTPDTVFADVDVEEPSGIGLGWIYFLIIAAAGVWGSKEFGTWWVLAVAVLVGALLAHESAKATLRLLGVFRTDPVDAARARIEQFATDNPDWHLRLYRTPRGYRVLVMHQTFDPTEEPAFEFLKKLGSDPLYVTMCRNQKCFRARVSPKPWRIGMEHIRPRPGVWPIKAERMPQRHEWVRRYDEQSHRYASCRFEATLGSGRTDRKCEAVRRVHDKHCKAEQDLALA